MPKKQLSTPITAAGAAPARTAKTVAPRTRKAKHAKAPGPEPAETFIEVAEIPAEFIVESLVIAANLPVESENTQDAGMNKAIGEKNGVVAENEDPRETIARIAYGYWEARGRQGGDPLEDWCRAEEEYRQLTAA